MTSPGVTFQKAGLVESAEFVDPERRETLGCFRKRANLNSESVTMVTECVNLTWLRAGFLHQTPSLSLSPPPDRSTNAVSFPDSFSW